MKTVDLHAHTTASDGSLSPAELIRYASKKGLSAIAVTDHDAVAGLEAAMTEGERLGIQVIPGTELSTSVDDCTVHLVALFFDWKNETFLRRLSEMAVYREERNYRMMDKLESLGFPVSRKDLETFPEGQILARAHIAQLLIERGYATDLKDALAKYLNKGTPGYVEKEVFRPEECIAMIHECGGLIFVAHLHQIDPRDPAHCVDICRRLLEMGADGLETQYCEFDDTWRQITEDLASEYGCLRSGGSDFHGTMKKGLDLGVGYGDLQVPYSFVEAMEERLAQMRS